MAAAKPHKTALLNFMDVFSSVMSFVVILCGMLFLSGLLRAWEERTTTYFLMAMVAATYLVLLACLVVDMRHAHRVKAAALAKRVMDVWRGARGMKDSGEHLGLIETLREW